MDMALADPEPGVRELVVRVEVGVAECVHGGIAEVFEGRVAGVCDQAADTGEGEGKLLFDFEEGHCWKSGWRLEWFEGELFFHVMDRIYGGFMCVDERWVSRGAACYLNSGPLMQEPAFFCIP